ncbi:GTP-binding protein [Verrucomicrobiaceae bacterium 227]
MISGSVLWVVLRFSLFFDFLKESLPWGGGRCGKTLFVSLSNYFLDSKSCQHFLLVGGFLGAGKTTLIGMLTRHLEANQHRVALITNDQGEGLMDTVSARAASEGLGKVAEITGGCFCCRLDELVGAIRDLEAATRPDVMIAEPVGSCTDLMATVLQPLEKIYEMPLTLAPLSVVVDARRALTALGGKKSKRTFHRDIGYVYLKQLEEAEWLIVNKLDLLADEDLQDLKVRLQECYPKKRTFYLSAKTGEGLQAWFQAALTGKSQPLEVMAMDYERYAVGEALLGWVNLEGSVLLKNGKPGEWLLSLGEEIAKMLDERKHEIGHFKMSLEGKGKRWRVHQVMGDDELELIEEGSATQRNETAYRFLVNLRAEGEAKALQHCVHSALKNQDQAEVTFDNEAAFQPGKPVPTHRLG